MISGILSQINVGTTIQYRTDGRFFDISRLKVNTKEREALVRNFFFLDDCTLAAHSEEDPQRLAVCFLTTLKADQHEDYRVFVLVSLWY
jgi:hypothetical protein